MEVINYSKHVIIFKYQEVNDQPNVIYITGNEKSILVDAGPSPKFAKEVIDYLKNNKLRNPDYIVLTHYHWDHSFGICGFDSKVIASSFTNDRLASFMKLDFTKDNYISDSLINLFSKEHLNLEYKNLSDIRLREADIILDKEDRIDLGGIEIRIIPVTSSHTKGSLMVLADDLLMVGDASCEKIIGNDFVEDIPLLSKFIEEIKKIDCTYILEGHSNIILKSEFVKEIEEIIEDKK